MYLIPIDGAQNFSPMRMRIEFLGPKTKNAHVFLPVGMGSVCS